MTIYVQQDTAITEVDPSLSQAVGTASQPESVSAQTAGNATSSGGAIESSTVVAFQRLTSDRHSAGVPQAAAAAVPLAESEAVPVCTTYLPSGWVMEGVFIARSGLRIGGEFSGDIKVEGAPGTFEVEDGGCFRGSVAADHVSVRGTVEGSIDAGGGLVEIHKTSSITGDVTYSQIHMDGGNHRFKLQHVDATTR